MICQHCGAEIPDSDNFCTYCGASLVPQDVANSSYFAPPYLADIPAHRPPYKLNLNRLCGDTFELYKRNFGTMCLLGCFVVVIGVIFLPLQSTIFMLQQIVPRWEGYVLYHTLLLRCSYFLTIIQSLLSYYILLGILRQCLYLARGGTGFQANLMFPPFMMYLKLVGLIFLVGIISLAPMIPVGICYFGFVLSSLQKVDLGVSATPLIIAFTLILLIGYSISIWLSIRLFPAYYFIADRDARIFEALGGAWQASSKNFWRLFVGTTVFGFCAMLGIVLLGIGIVLTIAVSWLGATLAYMQLTGQPNCLDHTSATRIALNPGFVRTVQ